VRGDELMVAVAVRDEAPSGQMATPRGRWRDVLRGEERSFAAREPLERVLGKWGLAIYERL
jgi:hypothetical protein